MPLLSNRAFARFPDPRRRKAVLGEAARAVVERFLGLDGRAAHEVEKEIARKAKKGEAPLSYHMLSAFATVTIDKWDAFQTLNYPYGHCILTGYMGLRPKDADTLAYEKVMEQAYGRARMEEILGGGHEVGHHGYLHEWIDPDYPDKEREALEKGLEALQRVAGVKPAGYRSPAGETSENMVSLLQEYGFLYDSSLMDTINPYRHRLADGRPGPIELPWHWSLDDAPYALFSIKTPRPIFTNEHILSIWTKEFEEIHRWGGLVNIVTHPQIIGRPSRLADRPGTPRRTHGRTPCASSPHPTS